MDSRVGHLRYQDGAICRLAGIIRLETLVAGPCRGRSHDGYAVGHRGSPCVRIAGTLVGRRGHRRAGELLIVRSVPWLVEVVLIVERLLKSLKEVADLAVKKRPGLVVGGLVLEGEVLKAIQGVSWVTVRAQVKGVKTAALHKEELVTEYVTNGAKLTFVTSVVA